MLNEALYGIRITLSVQILLLQKKYVSHSTKQRLWFSVCLLQLCHFWYLCLQKSTNRHVKAEDEQRPWKFTYKLKILRMGSRVTKLNGKPQDSFQKWHIRPTVCSTAVIACVANREHRRLAVNSPQTLRMPRNVSKTTFLSSMDTNILLSPSLFHTGLHSCILPELLQPELTMQS